MMFFFENICFLTKKCCFWIKNTTFELLDHHHELNQLKSLPLVFFSAQSVLPEPSYELFLKKILKNLPFLDFDAVLVNGGNPLN